MTEFTSKSATFWNKAAEKYAKSPISNMEAYTASLSRTKYWLNPDMRVLELGCGTGSTAIDLKDHAGHILGTDFSREMIRIARQKLVDQTIANVRFDVADAANPTPDDDTFDAVMAFNLLHLAPDPETVIAKARAALPNGGLFISKTPCLGGIWWIRPLISVLNLIGKAPGKVHTFRANDLRRMMQDNGFEIVETGAYPEKLLNFYIVAKAV